VLASQYSVQQAKAEAKNLDLKSLGLRQMDEWWVEAKALK
jgi:hypothetical protein